MMHMRRRTRVILAGAAITGAVFHCLVFFTPLSGAQATGDFVRGDCNVDGTVDISDAITTLLYLFNHARAHCLDAHDANDDGSVDIADAVYVLGYLFMQGPALPEPRTCGPDPTPDNPSRELGCAVPCTPPGERESPWPMFRHDAKHTGRTPYTGPSTATLAWTYETEDAIASSPTIGRDGTIYIGTGWQLPNSVGRHLYALLPDGTLKWRLDVGDGVFSSPTIGPDDTIYFTTLDGDLFAIEDRDTTAVVKWKLYTRYGFNLSSPAVGSDGTIYLGSPSFEVQAITSDGQHWWSHRTGWCVISSPAIGDNGMIYIGSKDAKLYAFRPGFSTPAWAFATGEFYDGHLVDSSPAIGSDGTIYVGTDQYGAAGKTPVPCTTNFWAVNPDGTLKWVFETEDGVESSPAVGQDGTIYFGSYDGHLYAVSDNGTEGALKWKFQTGGAIDGSPAVDGDGRIYIGSRSGTLYALNPDGSVRWTFEAGDGFESSPTIDGNGFLYIGCMDGTVYALGTGSPDVGVRAIHAPPAVEPGTVQHPRARVVNYRARSQSFDVACTITTSGSTVYADTVTVSLPGGGSADAFFSPWLVSAGGAAVYTVTVRTVLPADDNDSNDERSVQVEGG